MGITSLVRSRWAAIGAAVAITLGGGGLNIALAGIDPDTPSAAPDQLYFVPITPCRLLDTRTASQIGARSTPFGAGALQAFFGTGDRGNCVGISENSQALSLNVTATNATANTYLTLWPSDATRPTASNLNPKAGVTTANAVTVALSPTDQFSIYNAAGNVQVIVDVVGYYTPLAHNHLSAVVSSTGALNRGVGATSADRNFEGGYTVIFDRDISDCTYVASLGNTDLFPEPPGYATTSFGINPVNVYVDTFDATGVDADSDFHLIVLCPDVVVAVP